MLPKVIGWLLLGCWFLSGCTSAPAAISGNISVPLTATSVSPTTPLDPLPATATAVATVTNVAIDVTPGGTPPTDSRATLVPSATFAAFGITQTIGASAGGRPLISYRFGYGRQTIVLVGGIHGGYEWNTTALAYEMIDYFQQNPDRIPTNVSLYIIPSANPDGQFIVTGVDGRFTPQDVSGDIELGRFNANEVDLNRNWACGWQPQAIWGNTVVSGGAAPFSEPETIALRTFFQRVQPEVVLLWHSKADGIYVGGCDVLYQPAKDIAEIYGDASGYRVNDRFTAYPVTGDASDWLTSQSVPSFTMELQTRNQTDYLENLAGVLALLDYYGR